MGIKKLKPFLEKHVPAAFVTRSLHEYAGKSLAIDLTLYLYEFKRVYARNWVNALLRFALLLRRYQVRGVYVYDTKTPTLKLDCVAQRRSRRANLETKITELVDALAVWEKSQVVGLVLKQTMQKHIKTSKADLLLYPRHQTPTLEIDVSIIQREIRNLRRQIIYVTRWDIDLSKELLSHLGLPCLNADDEAERTCCHLTRHHMADFVMTNDTDALTYGTTWILMGFDLEQETVVEVSLPKILDGLAFSHRQFQDFCILCGTDYNENIRGIGPEKAYKLLRKHGSIETMLAEERLNGDHLNLEAVRDRFQLPTEPLLVNLQENAVDHDSLHLFMEANHCDMTLVEDQEPEPSAFDEYDDYDDVL